jgi:hypothetical protein
MRIKEITENKTPRERIPALNRTRKQNKEKKLKDHIGSVISIGYQAGGGNWGNSRI